MVLRTHVAGVAIGTVAGGDRSGRMSDGGAGLRALGGGACLNMETGAACGTNSGEVADSAEDAVCSGRTGSSDFQAGCENRFILAAGTVAENSKLAGEFN